MTTTCFTEAGQATILASTRGMIHPIHQVQSIGRCQDFSVGAVAHLWRKRWWCFLYFSVKLQMPSQVWDAALRCFLHCAA